jgi:hypothetical protein
MDINTLREYLKIHIVSLKQDREHADSIKDNSTWVFLTGEIHGINHILELINEH